MAKKSPKFVCPPGYVVLREELLKKMVSNMEGSMGVMDAAGLYIDGLVAYLKKYGDHDMDCPATDEFIGKCTCGWSKVERELKL